MLQNPFNKFMVSVLAAFCICFSQPKIITSFENSPIFLMVFALFSLLLTPRVYIDKNFFTTGALSLFISVIFTLTLSPSKALLIAIAVLFASTFKIIIRNLNNKIFCFSFLIIQALVMGVHSVIDPLLPMRGYFTFGTYSGTYAEPSYLAISIILLNVLYHSKLYFIFSFALILVSGSFFGLILMCLIGLHFSYNYRLLLLLIGASSVLFWFSKGGELRGVERVLLFAQTLDVYTYAIIDQSTSFRFLTLSYNLWSAIQNGFIFPYNTLLTFDLSGFLVNFYGSSFHAGLKNTVLHDGFTSSSMAGYALQHGVLFFLLILKLILNCVSNISLINKFVILSIFILQSFAFDLIFLFILMALREDGNLNKNR